jgi:hypothetical protein
LDPFASGILLPLAAAPYYYLYGRDLVRAGYRWTDLLRVYSLTLVLLPVNLAGVSLSLVQAATGKKASFGRTPKVENRTAVPAYYVAFNTLLFVIMVLSAIYSVATGHFARAIFPIINAGFYAYGITAFMGAGPTPGRASTRSKNAPIKGALATSGRTDV